MLSPLLALKTLFTTHTSESIPQVTTSDICHRNHSSITSAVFPSIPTHPSVPGLSAIFPFRSSFLLDAGALSHLYISSVPLPRPTHFVSFILLHGIVHPLTSFSSTSAQLQYPESLIDITRSSVPITYLINTYYNLTTQYRERGNAI